MSAVWLTIAGLVVTTAAIKAAGPATVGGRELPRWAQAIIALLAPALLSALVLTGTFSQQGELTVDARAAGLACAGAGVLARAPLLVTVLMAAAATAIARALFS